MADRTLTGWLPPERAVRRFVAVSFIDAVGTGMFLTGSALFFTHEVGLTVGQVGFGLSLAGVAGLLCSVPVGRLSDRAGALRVLVGLQFWRAACFFAYPFVTDLGWFIVVSCLAGAGEWAAPPVVQSLLGSLVRPASRVRTLSAMTVVRNVGFGLGAGSAAAAIAVGGGAVYRGLVIVDAVSFLLSGALLLRLREPGEVPPAVVEAEVALPPRVRPGVRYLVLAALNGGLALNAVILSVGLPLWIATRTRGPGALIGAMVVLNTVLAVPLQLRLSRGADGLRTAARRQLRAGLALAACCLLVAFTGTTGPVLTVLLVLAATVALTAAEVYQSIGAWGVSYGLSPETGRGYYLSVYGLGATGIMIAGPWLLATAVLPAHGYGWLGLAVLSAGCGALVPMVVGKRPAVPDDHLVREQ